MSKSQFFVGIPASYRRNVVFKSILIFVAGLILTTVVLYLAVQQPIGPTYGEGFRMLSELQDDIVYKASIIYAITVFVTLGGIIFLTLIYSHRVAGPVFRLSAFAKTLVSGDFRSSVHIRQNDVIHPLADMMNKMVGDYRSTLKNIQDEITVLEKSVEQIKDGKDDDKARQDVEKSAGKIAAELEKYDL